MIIFFYIGNTKIIALLTSILISSQFGTSLTNTEVILFIAYFSKYQTSNIFSRFYFRKYIKFIDRYERNDISYGIVFVLGRYARYVPKSSRSIIRTIDNHIYFEICIVFGCESNIHDDIFHTKINFRNVFIIIYIQLNAVLSVKNLELCSYRIA